MPHFLAALYQGTPANFESPLPLADVAQRLRQLSSVSAGPMLRECVSGTVDEWGEVCLWREIYQWRNSFAPCYYGTLTERDGTTYLKGSFKPPLFTRLFMAFVMLFVMCTLCLLAYLMVQMQAWPFLAGFAVVALLIAGIVATGRTTASGDAEAIRRTIRQALGA